MRLQPQPQAVDTAQSSKTSGARRKSKKRGAGAPHAGRMNAEELAQHEREHPSITRLVYNTKNGINLNSQSQTLKKFGQAIIKQFKVVQAFEESK